MKQNIEFVQAIQIQKEINQQKEEKLQEFLESKCDLFSSADWQYYANETGKSISWLMQNANYNDQAGAYGTMLENAMIDGDTELLEQFI